MSDFADLTDDAYASRAAGLTLGTTDAEPDKVAEARKLARRYNLPPALAESFAEDYKARARRDDADAVTQLNPKLASWIAKPENARIAADDVQSLGAIESTVRDIRDLGGAFGKGVVADAVGSTFSGLGRGYDIAARGLAGLLPDPVREALDVPIPRWLDPSEALLKGPGRVFKKIGEALGPEQQTFATDVAAGLGQFAGQAAASVVLPVSASLTILFGQGLDVMGEKVEGDAAPQEVKDAATLAGAGLTAVTEKYAIDKILGPLAVPIKNKIAAALARIGIGAATEGVQEFTENIGQDVIRQLATNPDARVDLDDALYGAGVGASVGGIARTLIESALHVKRRRDVNVADAQRADDVADRIEQLSKLAEADVLRGRDADTFKDYVAQLEEDGEVPTDLYVAADVLANSLNQSGMTIAELQAVAPVAAQQLAEGAPADSQVRIPLSEFAAAGEKFAAPLIDHLRAAPEAMSRADARAYMETEGAQLQADMERELQQVDDATAYREDVDAVRTTFEQELAATKRFRPEVNTAYATLLGNFYGSTAARLGMKPQELLDRYRLRVASTVEGGAQTLEQGAPVALLSGAELGEVVPSDSAVVVARDWFKANLQGKTVERPGFGSVRFTGKGWGKLKNGLKMDPLKVKLLPAITGIITKGEYRGRNVLDAPRPDGTVAFHHFVGGVKVGSELVQAGVSVGEDAQGNYFYNVNANPDDLQKKAKGPEVTREAARGSEPFSGAETNTLNQSVVQGDEPFNIAVVAQGGASARAQLSFASDITTAPSVISLLEGADLSSFVHESAHFFLEVQADLAQRIQQQISDGASVSDGEREIVADMGKLLKWFDVKGEPGVTPLEMWGRMTLDERRDAHERFARGFEAYAFEGKAPSIELQGLFLKFRSWMLSVYKSLKALNVTLDDDVRGVMDRMLATDRAITEAEAQRNMGPLFATAEAAGMTLEQYQAYQAQGAVPTANAIEELQGRALRDMKWLGRARDKALKARQAEVEERRRDMRMEARAEIMQQPVYRLWQFLAGKGEAGETADKPKASNSKSVDPGVDSMFTAIAKLGGLDRASAANLLGIDPKAKSPFPVFGKPVWRNEGGKTADEMADRLAELQYLTLDEDGKYDFTEFGDRFSAELRGDQQFSLWFDMGDQPVQPLPGGVSFGKLSTSALQEQYGMADTAVWRRLSARRMTSEKAGLPPDVVAETFGFTSADEMVQALAEAKTPAEAIAERTDQLMLESFGDITSPEALQRAADEAVHNEARARFITTELKALRQALTARADTGQRNARGQAITVDAMAKAAKTYAAEIIARQRVRDLRPTQYAAAEARNARLAMTAFAAANTEEAAMHKRNQLVNHYAAKAAYAAQDEVKSIRSYLRKFDKRSKSVDPAYLGQIDGLLERFDFRPATNKALARRVSLADWYDAQVENGITPDIPPELLDEARSRSYRDMTVEELRGLRDTVKQIEHLGRLKNKLLLAKDQRTFDAIADDMAAVIVANGGKPKAQSREGVKGFAYWLEGAKAIHRKLSSLFRQMDGKDDGPLYERIVRPMNEQGTAEDVMLEKATLQLQKLYAPMLKLRGGLLGSRSKVYIPEIKDSLTRGGRLAVALNWGNDDNRQRLLGQYEGGNNWTEAQVRAILRTLSPQELEFVNGVWEYLDSYWPQVAEKQKRLTGEAPEKVQASPFVVVASDGSQVSMRGGYYPIKYDPDRSDRTETQDAQQAAKEMMQGATTRATTRRGHIEARLKEVKRPVLLNLNVITQHVTQVVHDLTWHEWLIDTSRLLRDERVVDAIRTYYGPQVLRTVRDNVLGIATGDATPQTAIDRAIMLARSNVTRATMGASITTAFLQPFGLTQSMVRIGPKHVIRGAARWAGDAARMENTLEWIRGKSDFMRLRAKTFNRELREIKGRVEGRSAAMQAVDGGLFWMMQKMQLVADVPTWVGQYEKSIAAGQDEASAVAAADRAVLEAQGGGAIKDLAEVQRKHPLLTQFYSYFSVTLNLTAERTAATDFKNPRAVAGWLGDMALLLAIPAVGPAYIIDALRGGDDDDEEGLAEKVGKWQAGYLLGMVVGLRELTGTLSGFDYAGPPVGRIVGDIGKAGQQTAQGELDEPAVLAYARLMGTAFGLPITQIIRSYKGWKAWDEGEAGPAAVLVGPPPP